MINRICQKNANLISEIVLFAFRFFSLIFQIVLAPFKCSLTDGDGEGASETKVSTEITGEACIQKCIEHKKTEPSVNGVTVNRDGTGGCWCELGMTNIYNDQRFQTCFLERGNSQLKLSLSDQMYVCLSEDTFFTTLNTLLLSNFVSL